MNFHFQLCHIADYQIKRLKLEIGEYHFHVNIVKMLPAFIFSAIISSLNGNCARSDESALDSDLQHKDFFR